MEPNTSGPLRHPSSALAGLIAFYGMNGRRLTLTNEEAYELVMRVAGGELDQVNDIADWLQRRTSPL